MKGVWKVVMRQMMSGFGRGGSRGRVWVVGGGVGVGGLGGLGGI